MIRGRRDMTCGEWFQAKSWCNPARIGAAWPNAGGRVAHPGVQDAATHQYFCPYEIATVYVSLGDHDTADDLFRKGTTVHADCMAWLVVEPWLDSFRSDARYGQLLRDIGLAPATR
jgi:hypothetical protein